MLHRLCLKRPPLTIIYQWRSHRFHHHTMVDHSFVFHFVTILRNFHISCLIRFFSYLLHVDSGILATPETTAIPAPTLPYAIPSTHLHPLQIQPTIEYSPHPFHAAYQPHPTFQPHPAFQQHPAFQPHGQHPPHATVQPQVFQPQAFQPQVSGPYDFLRSLFHKQPANLIDSYIPSNLLYAMQRNRHAAIANAHVLSALPPSPNFGTPTLGHPSHLFQQGSHQPGYNTIAYSTNQNYFKRSPKLNTDHPSKGNKKGI